MAQESGRLGRALETAGAVIVAVTECNHPAAGLHAAKLIRRKPERCDFGSQCRFETATATDYSNHGYDLIAFFDCLHDTGDPAGACKHAKETLKPDGAIDEAQAAYAALAGAAATPPLGVLIRYPDDSRALPEPADATRITVRGHKPARSELINYALVGAGAFGMSMLVPQMKKRKDRYFLRGVVSRNSTQGGNFARDNGVEVLATELKTVLDDPSFHLMVIATRHHEHAAQVVECLKAGKHVFVEKPLAISWSQLDAVVSTYNGLEDKPLLMVGFNRRFSPAVTEVRKLVAGRRAPLMIEYRLNGGYIPLDSWVQGEQGGGRNIGEACHMYDVFRSLTGAPVKSITATPIDPGTLPYLRNDNFAATLGYEDGSVANLVYTALGPKTGMGKERIEVFCDGDAFVVDDFKKLIRASDGNVLWQNGDPDKGHAEELSLLGDALATGGPSPIPFDEIIETTAVALHVEDLLFHREERSE